MRNGRVIMATAVRQFEYENKKHLRQDALMRRRFLLNGFFGGWCICHVWTPSFVILNLFQDNEPRSHVILKQVQDDELWGEGVGSTPISAMTHFSPECLSLQTYTENAVFL